MSRCDEPILGGCPDQATHVVMKPAIEYHLCEPHAEKLFEKMNVDGETVAMLPLIGVKQ